MRRDYIDILRNNVARNQWRYQILPFKIEPRVLVLNIFIFQLLNNLI